MPVENPSDRIRRFADDNARAGTAAVTRVPSSVDAVQILAANPDRLRLLVYNESTQTLYLKYGSGASSTSYTVQLASGDYFECPGRYTGLVTGAWAGANGAAMVTELTV